MTKNLTSIIKDTLKTISGFEAIQYYRENIKEIKKKYYVKEVKTITDYVTKELGKGYILKERFMLTSHLMMKSFNIGFVGIYAYAAITGDHTITDYIQQHGSHSGLATTFLSSVILDTLLTIKVKSDKQVKADRKRMNDEFNRFYKTFEEAYYRQYTRGSDNSTSFSANNLESNYKILGIKYPAPMTEVKKAYRKIAKETHPDANGGDKSREGEFKKAANAYNNIDAYFRNRKKNN